MKKLVILLVLQFIIGSLYSQTLELSESKSILDSWIKSKGASTKVVTEQLKKKYSKWSLKSQTPEVEEYSKSYYWTSPTEMGELQFFILSVEEDEETLKYSVRYQFYHLGKFTAFVASLKDNSKAGEAFETFDNVKDTYSILVDKPDCRYLLSAENVLNESGKTFRAFKVDITTKYINK